MSGLLEPLTTLTPGMPLIVGGDKIVRVDAALAASFCSGDALLVVPDTGELLHIPKADRVAAFEAVSKAAGAFAALGDVDDATLDTFFEGFAARLDDDTVFAQIVTANNRDVEQAKARGRSTTRLVITETMRRDMIAGLHNWADTISLRGQVQRTITHEGFTLEEVTDRLGVIGFVFEGRPNVFADALGVLRSGNTVVFRIGSDALHTARAIVTHVLEPATQAAGLPQGCVALVDAASHASGWALFSDSRLALAVARGSGKAVQDLSAVALQAGVPVSAHGTGGAWLIATGECDPKRLHAAVLHSLDRKVCNTLNVCVVPRMAADTLMPVVLDALTAAANRRNSAPKLHVVGDASQYVPTAWFDVSVAVVRADGTHQETRAEPADVSVLATEWEWEDAPEVSVVLCDDLADGISLFNRYAPRFVLSLISPNEDDHVLAFNTAEAPYIGDGFTRWVDGQYALNVPELGLSNWESGRLLARGGILTGEGITTLRYRVRQADPKVSR